MNGLLLAWGDQFAARFGLTSARWQMLGAIALADRPLTAPQLATNMGVTRQAALKQLNLLAAEELVVAQPNRSHKRSPIYTLSDSGSALFQAIDAEWQALARSAGADMTSKELHVVAAVFARFSAFVQREKAQTDEA
ncbi:MarR family winged helix-turn-helix transcriptional regulator [Luteibacter sp. 9135]|uniref:MarR family winged helix-turn-helix transcriptional regulator n=1 Tax=Luteibacter sp. 9135 TaxID=1500893 RepID=UPI00068F473F|nr:MarR family winged helix-turn-helix transcriptional regulator [Luteibacter sp. 9135]